MKPWDPDVGRIAATADADALEAPAKSRRSGSGRLLVPVGEKRVGIVTHKDLLPFINWKLELEGDDADTPAHGNERDGSPVA